MSDPYRPLKDAFGRFATGVTLAGCAGPDGAAVFITVNSFASVSLEPALVSWSIERKASTFPAFMTSEGYSINVLKAEQQGLSERFAQHAPAPLSPLEYESWVTGAPVLKDCLAAFDCRIMHRHAAGDHVMLVAEVVRFSFSPGRPLLYFASQYAIGPEAEQ